MGSSNDYYGAFRITPRVDAAIACRLNLWLNSRHFDRVGLKRDLGLSLNTKDETIFGFIGKDGELVMPSFSHAWEGLVADGINPSLAPHLMGDSMADRQTDEVVQIVREAMKIHPSTQESRMAAYAKANEHYNVKPGSVYSLWSNLIIINDPDNDFSYLTWNGCEKSYHMREWFLLMTFVLRGLGYTVEGTILEVMENGGSALYTTECDQLATSYKENTLDTFTFNDESEKAKKRSEEVAKQQDLTDHNHSPLLCAPEYESAVSAGLGQIRIGKLQFPWDWSTS